jgi:hypothetical protein
MKLKMFGVIYGGMPTTLLQNFIISLIKMFSPQDLSYGSGTPAALTKSESLVGSCTWIDLMLETFSEEKSTSLRETTTTGSYASITGKKPHFTSSSPVLSVKPVGAPSTSIGTLQLISTLWWMGPKVSSPTIFSWKSSSLQPGWFGNKETTSSSIKSGPAFRDANQASWMRLDFKLIEWVWTKDRIF